jgi:hypothetical protein
MSLTFSNDDNGNKPLYYLAVTLSANDGNGFQQKIDFDASTYSSYLSSTVSNINFQDGAGNLLYSWQETHAPTTSSTDVIYWLKLPNATITTVYIVFVATTASSISATHTGAEPNYSATYGPYDTGASVFNNYWNFAGTSLPSGLTAYGDTSTVTVDNGITIEPSTNTWTGVYSTATISAPAIMETYATFPSTTGDGDVVGGYSSYAGGAGVGAHPAGQDWAIGTTSAGAITAWTTINTNPFPTSNTIFGFYFVSGALAVYGNYVQQITLADSVTSDNIALGRYPDGTYTSAITAVWLRTRTYPSGGTMPTLTYGTVTSVPSGYVSLLMAC